MKKTIKPYVDHWLIGVTSKIKNIWFQVKNHLWLFVNCLIVNPTFDSQTKENMTLVPKEFGSKCVLTEKFNKELQKDCYIFRKLKDISNFFF